MKTLIGILFFVSTTALADACYSKNKDFFQSRSDLSCLACAGEAIDNNFRKDQASVAGISPSGLDRYQELNGASDRYWAFLATAVRQFYSNGDSISDQDFTKQMIRLATVLGPCRDRFYDPQTDPLTQLQKDYTTERQKKYSFPDLKGNEADSIAEFTQASAYSKNLTQKARVDGQTVIAKVFGFKRADPFLNLMNKPEGFENMSNESLRQEFKVRFDHSRDDLFTNDAAGRAMKSCVLQLRENLASSVPFAPVANLVCEKLTRACFKNSDMKVNEVCDRYGLTTSKPFPNPAGGSTDSRGRPFPTLGNPLDSTR